MTQSEQTGQTPHVDVMGWMAQISSRISFMSDRLTSLEKEMLEMKERVRRLEEQLSTRLTLLESGSKLNRNLLVGIILAIIAMALTVFVTA